MIKRVWSAFYKRQGRASGWGVSQKCKAFMRWAGVKAGSIPAPGSILNNEAQQSAYNDHSSVKLIFLAALLALPLHAEHRLWKASLAALAGASAWDTQSSYGGMEANPVLGHGNFGARQAGVKIGVIGGVALVEWITVRKTHRDRVLTWTNFAVAGVTAGVAVRNTRMR